MAINVSNGETIFLSLLLWLLGCQTANALTCDVSGGIDAGLQNAFNMAAGQTLTIPPCPSGQGYNINSLVSYAVDKSGALKISCPGYGTPFFVNNATGGWQISQPPGQDYNASILIAGGCAFYPIYPSRNVGYALQLSGVSMFRVQNIIANSINAIQPFTRAFDLEGAQQGLLLGAISARNGTGVYFNDNGGVGSNQNNIVSFRSDGDYTCLDFEGGAGSNAVDALSCQGSVNGVRNNQTTTSGGGGTNNFTKGQWELNTLYDINVISGGVRVSQGTFLSPRALIHVSNSPASFSISDSLITTPFTIEAMPEAPTRISGNRMTSVFTNYSSTARCWANDGNGACADR